MQVVKSHESVVDVLNHSVIFSLKEDLSVPDVADSANVMDDEVWTFYCAVCAANFSLADFN